MAKRIVDEDLRFNVIINGNEAQAQLYQLEKRNRELNESSKALRAEKAKLEAQGKKNTEAYRSLTAELKKNNLEVNQNKSKMLALQKQIGITGLTMRQLKKRASELRLQLANMLPKDPRRVQFKQELIEINRQLDKLSVNSKTAQSGISKLANGFNKYFTLGASVVAAGTGVILSLQKMIDYNGKLSDAQSNVQKTTGLTAKEVDNLTKSFGAFKTRTARIELLELAEEAGRLGKNSTKDVLDFVKVANQLKVALGDDLSTEQIREVGKMVNIYKVGAKEGKTFEQSMLSLGSSINEVSASGANTADFLVDYLKRQSGVASQTKLAAADNIGYAATFDEIGQSVEVSATAMNKIWIDMFENTDVYAKIAGMTLKDFTQLLNTDANAAMIKFLKGLNGNNEGLSIMVDKLKDLEVGGARGVQALSALASNTALLEERQNLANKSLKEATSLTNEYELKNNNLAATIEKVKKAIIGAFSSEAIIGALAKTIGWFGRLIGVIDDVNEVFKEETKVTYESAKANRALADESSKLLNEYNQLTAEGVEPTTASKERLEEITLLLRDRLGESVVAINKETGALMLNTEAVREQIKVKRLASDEEAATLVSRLRGAKDEKSDLESKLPALEKEYEIRKRLADAARIDFRNSEEYQKKNQRSRLSSIANLDAVKQEQEAFLALNKVKGQITEQELRRIDILEKLKSLNFTEADADKFFEDTNTDLPTEPQEGDVQYIDGRAYVFKNGSWVLQTIRKPPKDPDKINQAKKEADELLKLQRETIEQRLALIDDAFKREMALNDEKHIQQVQDLEKKSDEILTAYDQAIKKGDTDTASILLDQYTEIQNQIEISEVQHQAKRNQILEEGIQARVDAQLLEFQYQEDARLTAHNNELAALGNNEIAKQALQDKYDKESLEREKAHQELVVKELQKILDSASFEDFSIELLTDAQLQAIKDRLASLGLSLSEINALLAKMKGGVDPNALGELSGLGIDANGRVDILGMNDQQWAKIFERTETLAGAIGKIGQVVGAASQAYGMYNQFVTASEQKKLNKLEQATQEGIAKQKRLLDSGLISKRQHDDAVQDLEDKLNKKKAETEYKQAKRQKKMNIAAILGNQAVAVSKALAQGGFVLGIPWAAIVAGLAGLQLALAVAQPLPAKGFESGYYGDSLKVQREQDGKLFNAAYGGESRSGLVDKPTVFMAGEGGKNFPELIVDGRTLKQFDPELKNSLYREISRIRGFENGYYNNSNQNTENVSSGNELLLTEALNRNSLILEKLEAEGVIAYMSKRPQDIRDLDDEIKKHQKRINKNIR